MFQLEVKSAGLAGKDRVVPFALQMQSGFPLPAHGTGSYKQRVEEGLSLYSGKTRTDCLDSEEWLDSVAPKRHVNRINSEKFSPSANYWRSILID